MTVVTPVWVWLPGQDEPTRAGEIVSSTGSRFIYQQEYLKTAGALASDPVELRLSRSSRGTAILGSDGLPGVIRDAKPAGYGEDRLKATHGNNLETPCNSWNSAFLTVWGPSRPATTSTESCDGNPRPWRSAAAHRSA